MGVDCRTWGGFVGAVCCARGGCMDATARQRGDIMGSSRHQFRPTRRIASKRPSGSKSNNIPAAVPKSAHSVVSHEWVEPIVLCKWIDPVISHKREELVVAGKREERVAFAASKGTNIIVAGIARQRVDPVCKAASQGFKLVCKVPSQRAGWLVEAFKVVREEAARSEDTCCPCLLVDRSSVARWQRWFMGE